jgi:hypothetical protein
MAEEEKKESKLDVLKDAITNFVNCDVNELRDSTKKSDFLDNFKTILKADDSGVYSWLEKILPFMKQEADVLGITVNPKEEFETESEPEAPVEEAPEAEATPEEAPEEETATEEAPVEEVKKESQEMTSGEFLVEIANNFIDD